MRYKILYILLFFHLLGFTQNKPCNLPMSKAEIIQSNGVFWDGKALKPQDQITIQVGLTSNTPITKAFLNCNNLRFKDHESQLILRYSGQVTPVKLQIHFDTHNLSSRGNLEAAHKLPEMPPSFFHNYFLTPDRKALDYELEAYFPNAYWIGENDTLVFQDEKIAEITFKFSHSEIGFPSQNQQFIIDNDLLPENGKAAIVIETEDSEPYLIKDVQIHNLIKVTQRLRAIGFDDTAISAFIYQNHLIFDIEKLTEGEKEILNQKIESIIRRKP